MSREKWKLLVELAGPSDSLGEIIHVGLGGRDAILWADSELTRLRSNLAAAEKVVEAAVGCSHGDYCSEEECYCGYDKVEQALYAYRALTKKEGG